MQTIEVHGTNGEIMVPFATPGTFIRGKRIGVEIIAVGSSPDIPPVVKEALVGLRLEAVLTREQVIEQCGISFEEFLPMGCLLTYVEEVIMALQSSGKHDVADILKKAGPNQLDMYVLEAGTFRLLH